MQRLTPQEFFEQNREKFLYQIPAKHQSICIQEMLQAYAEHCEATAWVTDGSLPPVDISEDTLDWSEIVLVESSVNATAYASLKSGLWFDARTHDRIENVTAWRHLSTPPSQ